MKKIITLMLICAMILCCACHSNEPAPDDNLITQAPVDTQAPIDTQTPSDETTSAPTSEPTPVPTDEPSDVTTPDDVTDFDPNGDIAPEFCAVWKYTDDIETDNFVGIYYGNTFVIVDDVSYIEGTVKPISPSEILLVDDDGTEVMTLTMLSAEALLADNGRTLFYYLDVVDERLNEDSDSDDSMGEDYSAELSNQELEEFFYDNCFYSVDNEFYADAVRTLYPFVGKWMLIYDGEYFIDETFAYRGIMIYADDTWTWVNAHGIPAMTPGQVISADQESVTLYDVNSDSEFTLTINADGDVLTADNGDTYTIESGINLMYPLYGAPIEVIGKWTGDEGLGSFLIDRTGMVIFDDAPGYAASVSTLSRDTIGITIGEDTVEISIYEAPAGVLVDSIGTVYYKAE